MRVVKVKWVGGPVCVHYLNTPSFKSGSKFCSEAAQVHHIESWCSGGPPSNEIFMQTSNTQGKLPLFVSQLFIADNTLDFKTTNHMFEIVLYTRVINIRHIWNQEWIDNQPLTYIRFNPFHAMLNYLPNQQKKVSRISDWGFINIFTLASYFGFLQILNDRHTSRNHIGFWHSFWLTHPK